MSGPISKQFQQQIDDLTSPKRWRPQRPSTRTPNFSGSFWLADPLPPGYPETLLLTRKRQYQPDEQSDSLAAFRAIRDQIRRNNEDKLNRMHSEVEDAISELKASKIKEEKDRSKIADLKKRQSEIRGEIKQLDEKIDDEVSILSKLDATWSELNYILDSGLCLSGQDREQKCTQLEACVKQKQKARDAIIGYQLQQRQFHQQISDRASEIKAILKQVPIEQKELKEIDADFKKKWSKPSLLKPRFLESTFSYCDGNHRIVKKVDYSLYDFINSSGILITKQEAREIFAQILMAIKEFHDNEIAHRDIKPDNLLIIMEEVLIKEGNATPQRKRLFKVELIDVEDAAAIYPNGKVKSEKHIHEDGRITTDRAFLGKVKCGAPLTSAPEYLQALFNTAGQVRRDLKDTKAYAAALCRIDEDTVIKNFDDKIDLTKNDCYGLGYILNSFLISGFIRTSPEPLGDLQDLVTNLMLADPAKRFTLEQAQRHPFFTLAPPKDSKVTSDTTQALEEKKADRENLPFFDKVLERRDAFSEYLGSETLPGGYYIASAPDPQDTFYLLPPPLQEVARIAKDLKIQISAIESMRDEVSPDNKLDLMIYIPMLTSMLQTKVRLQQAITNAEIQAILYGYSSALDKFSVPDVTPLFAGIHNIGDESKLTDDQIASNHKGDSIRAVLEFIIRYFSDHPIPNRDHGRHNGLLELAEEMIRETINPEARPIGQTQPTSAPTLTAKTVATPQTPAADKMPTATATSIETKSEQKEPAQAGTMPATTTIETKSEQKKLISSRTRTYQTDKNVIKYASERTPIREIIEARKALQEQTEKTKLLPILKKYQSTWSGSFFGTSSKGRCGNFVEHLVTNLETTKSSPPQPSAAPDGNNSVLNRLNYARS